MTEQQQEERQTVRVVFYLTPEWAGRMDEASARPKERLAAGPGCAVWLNGHSRDEDKPELDMSDDEVTLQLQLVEARAENRGLQALVDQLRERLGMADAHNVDLNRRLEEAHTTVDRVTMMLPAAGQTERTWWKFW